MKRLTELRKSRNITQSAVAGLLGITRPAYTNYETGARRPDHETLCRLAEFYGVSVDYLLEREDKKNPSGRVLIRLPVYGKAAAGAPIFTEDDITGYVGVFKDDVSGGDYTAIRVSGDSMEPNIMDGDIVIVRVQPDVDSGQVAVVLIGGEEASVKKLIRHKDGIVLMSNNPDYEPMVFSKKDIVSLPVSVYGKVVELRRKFG